MVSSPLLISLTHGHELFRKVKFQMVCSPASMYRDADKSLARPTSRCRRTESKYR